MIGARRLLELACSPAGSDAAGDVDEGLRMIARAKPPVAGKAVKLPSRPDLIEGLRAVLTDAEQAGLLAEVVALLRQPIRAYELSAERPDRRLLLLGCFGEPDDPQPLASELTIPAHGPLSARWSRLSSSREQLAQELEEMCLGLASDGHSSPDRDRLSIDAVLIIGGSDNEARLPGWTARVHAIAAAQGFSATTLANVAPRIEATQQRARKDFHGRAQYVIAAYCGGDDNVERLHESGYGRSFLVEEGEPGDQLIILRLLLDELAETLPDPPAQQSFTPTAGTDYYFKKIAAGGGNKGDVMVHKTDPCSHDKWVGGHKGDQARMGIAALVGQQPTSLRKCSQCEGGGLWRARFG